MIIEILIFLCGVFSTTIAFSFTTGRALQSFITRLDLAEERLTKGGEKFKEYDERMNKSDVQFARIITKLDEIETRLMELKADFRGGK